MHPILFRLLVAVLVTAPVAAQPSSLAASGYRLPSNAFPAAPGQVMMVAVRGLSLVLAQPAIPTLTAEGFPTEFNGVSVDFVQGAVTAKTPIQLLEQTSCASIANCTPATSILLRIPYELDPASSTRALLRIKERGTVAGEIAIDAVTDNIHVINTCDKKTRRFVSAALVAEIPAGVCVPAVLNYSSLPPLVTPTTPAKAGNVLAIYAYGLGAIDPPERLGFRFATQPFTLAFYFTGAAAMPERRITGVPPAAVVAGDGTYQVNFVMPTIPEGLPACEGPNGYNLTVVVAGQQSAGSAKICVSR
ncbi:MAG: hypothetical protein U0Q16_17720 [Bryobacteraceae bacterium]